MQGVPKQFEYVKDRAEFRRLTHRPSIELYRAQIVQHHFLPHTHEAFGIGIIEKGVERFRYRGSEYLAAPGSIILMNPDELHTGQAETAEGWRYQMIYIDTQTVENVIGKKNWWFKQVLYNHPQLANHLSLLLRALWNTRDELDFDSKLFLVLNYCQHYAQTSSSKFPASCFNRFKRVIDYMKAHLANQITLNQLAQVSQLSPSYFLRAFQAEYHATPHQMLMALRLFEAKCLLANKVKPAMVAAMTGLTDQSHLTRAFKYRYGVTPGHYQQQICSR